MHTKPLKDSKAQLCLFEPPTRSLALSPVIMSHIFLLILFLIFTFKSSWSVTTIEGLRSYRLLNPKIGFVKLFNEASLPSVFVKD